MTTMLSRRALFRGISGGQVARRPPWTGEAFTDACTRCGDCIAACPDQLLFKGDGGYPEIRFDQDGCNFCGQCAQACSVDAFNVDGPAFRWRINLAANCLAFADIDCRSCEDACEPRAIRFRPALGRAAQPELSLDACNGCGACMAVCPADAVRLEMPNE